MTSGIEAVQWCSICRSRPSSGTLVVEELTIKELVKLPACHYCADKAMSKPKELDELLERRISND